MASRKPGKWVDAAWVLAMAAQGGLMIALPVLVGLALGFWLDNRLGTLPWISLALTLIGATIGPIMLYRWVTSSVAERMESRTKPGNKNQEMQDEETSG
jgi:F0F1-type ATP synthase assembly protein I